MPETAFISGFVSQDKFRSYAEYLRKRGAEVAERLQDSLPAFIFRSTEKVATRLPDQLSHHVIDIANQDRELGEELAGYDASELKEAVKGIVKLNKSPKYSGIKDVFDNLLSHSILELIPNADGTLKPNIVVGESYNASDKNKSNQLLLVTKILFEKFGFKDIMLPNVTLRFFNDKGNKGVVASGGFYTFDFLDIDDDRTPMSRSFIRYRLIHDREARKLFDYSKARVIIDKKGIRLEVALPEFKDLHQLGIFISEEEYNSVRNDLVTLLKGYKGEPAVKIYDHKVKFEKPKKKLSLAELMKLEPQQILEETLSDSMPDHLRSFVMNEHWFKDPKTNSLVMHPGNNTPVRKYPYDVNRVFNFMKTSNHRTMKIKLPDTYTSSEVIRAAERFKTHRGLNFELVNDFDNRQYDLYLESLPEPILEVSLI